MEIHAVGAQQFYPFGPDVLRFSHGNPDIGMDEIDTGEAVVDVLGQRDSSSGLLCALIRDLLNILSRP